MHVFAMMLFFTLGVTVLSMFAERMLNWAVEIRPIVLVGLGIGLAWAVDFNLWSMWGLHARAGWLAVTMTGLFIGGGAYLWHIVLGFVSGLLRKYHDQAATLEKTEQIHGVPEVGFGGIRLRHTAHMS